MGDNGKLPGYKVRRLGVPCYLCDREAVHVDHCHETGYVRGYLCGRHNMLAGHPDELLVVLAYVDASPIGEPYEEYKKRRRKTNYRDLERAQLQRWHANNRERYNEYQRRYYYQNLEKSRAYAREYYWRKKGAQSK